MTPEEITALKREHNAVLAEGQATWEHLCSLRDRMLSLRAQIKAADPEDYADHEVPLLFGAGFEMEEGPTRAEVEAPEVLIERGMCEQACADLAGGGADYDDDAIMDCVRAIRARSAARA